MARSADALDARDYQILLAVLRNPEHSQEAIGNALGLSARTINRRVNRPAFQAELQREYGRSIENAVLIARANAPTAVRRLVKIVKNTNAEDRDAIAAAREIHRLAIESKITVAFDERGLNVNHRLDLSALDEEELQAFERLLVKMGALAASIADGGAK